MNEDARFSGNSSSYTDEQLSVSLKFNGSVVYVYGDTVDVSFCSFAWLATARR